MPTYAYALFAPFGLCSPRNGLPQLSRHRTRVSTRGQNCTSEQNKRESELQCHSMCHLLEALTMRHSKQPGNVFTARLQSLLGQRYCLRRASHRRHWHRRSHLLQGERLLATDPCLKCLWTTPMGMIIFLSASNTQQMNHRLTQPMNQ